MATTILAALTLVLGAAAPAALAQDDDEGLFDGRFLVGYRYVDVDGAERKFLEDYNLGDGPRLFDFELDFMPEGELRERVDRVVLDVHTFGGDAFETLRFEAQSFGSWDFRYDRRKSEYFYEDIILPHELASVSLSSGGDFHHFDFERVRDAAQLDVRLTDAAKLHFGFDRFVKTGESTTTIDIQRDEFEFDKPIDETMSQYELGFEYAWDRVTLVLEETIRDYENLYEIFLPGFSLGENTTNNSTLDFFFLDQPYDYRAYQHTARVTLRPTTRWNVVVSASLQDLDLDVEADERAQGTGFNGLPFSTVTFGEGDIQRDTELFDVDLSYLVTERVAVVGAVRHRSLDQEGEMGFGADANVGEWRIDTTGAEAGVQVAVTADVTVAGGVLWEERDVEHAADVDGTLDEVHGETTEHTGFFLRGSWRPSQRFTLDASAEDSSYDDPFTLASPTDRLRLTLNARFNFEGGFFADASVRHQDFENDNSGWDAENEQARLRVGWSNDTLRASLAYTMMDVEREIDQRLTTGQLIPVFYEADSDFLDATLRWQATDRLAAGFAARLYDNGGTFALTRDDLRAYVETSIFESYLLRLTLRDVDYDEDAFDFDDYEAQVAEIAIGYAW